MKRLLRRLALAGLATAWFGSVALADVTADFSDLSLGANQFWNGSDGAGGFDSQAIHFGNQFTDWGYGYTSWAGFSYSRVNDTSTPGYGNEYAVISGTGVGGTGVYAVAYDDGPWGESDVITLPVPCAVDGFYINNTTYATLAMRDGNTFSRKFCAASNDWFKVTISAQDAYGAVTGTTDFYLADYRFADSAQDYIVTNWTWVGLTNLGSNVKSLHFALSSSDNGMFGMNTPAYFALDDLATLESYAPAAEEPGSTAVEMSSNALIRWATGWTNYIVGANCAAMWQTPNLATGVAVGTSFDICCLGEGGRITMTFDPPIKDGPGNDFAIVENSISDTFLELAYVEVSSDGTNFFRFWNRSLTPNPVGPFGEVNPEDVYHLGCKYQQGYSEPYDLGELRGTPGLDVNNVRYVRLLDISGNGSCTDSVGHVIYDPYLCTGSAGFDLDAIGVLSNNFQEVFVEALQPAISRRTSSNGVFRLTRKTWDASAQLNVAIVLGGTASNGVDYAWVTNTVVIPAGVTTRNVVIAPVPSAPSTGNVTVTMQILSGPGYVVETNGSAESIALYDEPGVSLALPSSIASRAGDKTGQVVVARNAVASDAPLAVHLTLDGTATDSDYAGLTNCVTLPPGVLSTTLYVRALASTSVKGDKVVCVHLAPDAAYYATANTQVAITIQDLPINNWLLNIAYPSLDNLPLTAGDYWNGSDGSGGFAINGIYFKNAFTDWGYGYTSWAGFAYSRVNNTTTPGYGNQYAVISGASVSGTGTYVVVYDEGPWSESDIITLPSPAHVLGFYINNTTYAALAMRDGNSFSRKFCAASNDWFKLTISGNDVNGGTVGSVDFYLADFRFADTNQDYILTTWTWVTLTNLGSNVKSLHFALSSSDNGAFGMNTPAYFAMDDFRVDPNSPAFGDTVSWDGSGEANLMLYALGRAPGDAYAPDLAPTNGAPFFDVTYRQRADLPDAGIGVEACTNLSGEVAWTTNGVVETVVGVDSGLATMRARIPGSDTNAAGFARLRAWRK